MLRWFQVPQTAPWVSSTGQRIDRKATTTERGGCNMADQRSYVYLGLAGETGAGRVVHSGLFRLADDAHEWEALQNGLPERPAVRALAVHPAKPGIIYAGTQAGPYRSAERGERCEKGELTDHGPPGWAVRCTP